MKKVCERGISPDIPGRLHGALVERIHDRDALTAYSCAWHGSNGVVDEYGVSEVPKRQLRTYRLRVRSLETRYRRMKGLDNLGDSVVGVVYDDTHFGDGGICAIYEGPGDWLLRVALPGQSRRTYADIAVLGGELTRATYVLLNRTTKPMQQYDLCDLADELTSGKRVQLKV
jgi:hypothetical protein